MTHTEILARLFYDQRPVRDLELRDGASLNGLEKGKSTLDADPAYLR
jgi:hypothetical protein